MRDALDEAKQRLACEIDSNLLVQTKPIAADPWVMFPPNCFVSATTTRIPRPLDLAMSKPAGSPRPLRVWSDQLDLD